MAQINKPTDYFNTNLWTGDDSNPRSITSTHATDFVWIKSRNQSYIHRLFDSVRGATKRLRSNGTDAEDTASTEVTAFTSTGYTINSGLNSTSPTTNWVGWSWLAGGTASSNTDGSITSSVSANTTSGFSIVSYDSSRTPSASQTVGHGLGVTPDCIIIKNREETQNWFFWNKTMSANNHLWLNATDSLKTDAGSMDNTLPTSSVFSIGADGRTNSTTNGTGHIAYCFAEKKGFSKFGSYNGNGSADGTFIYTGFKPAWVLWKRTDSATNAPWVLMDNKRSVDNPVDKYSFPNQSDAEGTANVEDFLSNGFKFRIVDNTSNVSGASYIYMAFAENPLVGTNNIPATAR